MYFWFVEDVIFSHNRANGPESQMMLCLIQFARWQQWRVYLRMSVFSVLWHDTMLALYIYHGPMIYHYCRINFHAGVITGKTYLGGRLRVVDSCGD